MADVAKPVCWSVIPKVTSQRYVQPVRKTCVTGAEYGLEICPHRVRELYHPNDASGFWQDRWISPLGYCWTGRIWPSASTVLSRDWSSVCLLCYRLPRVIGECCWQGESWTWKPLYFLSPICLTAFCLVVSRGSALLSHHTHYSRWLEVRLAQ